MNPTPKVLISYSHDSPEHDARVFDFANRMRNDGIDCIMDRLAPTNNWLGEMPQRMRECKILLVVCSNGYARENPEIAEFRIILRLSKEMPQLTIIPIIFEQGDIEFIPQPFQSYAYCNPYIEDDYAKLLHLLHQGTQPGVSEVAKGPEPSLQANTAEEELEESEADADVEKTSGSNAATFSAIFESDFTDGAWVVLSMARRLGQTRPEPSVCSMRRLTVALLLWGVAGKNAVHSGRWLVSQIKRDDQWILGRLMSLYPEISNFQPDFLRLLNARITPVSYMTQALKQTIDLARQLATESRPGQQDLRIATRHLLGALISRANHHANIERLLRTIGLDMKEVREGMLAQLQGWGVSDDLKIWKDILDPVDIAPEIRGVPVFRSDSATGPDLIGITREVEAMASLVSAWSIEPPLSIGLFGEWGSGKSFFMQKMKERVRQIAAAARKSGQGQKEFGYYKNIVQVEFNAWHYIEGDLWASLVEHIFSNLRLDGIGEQDLDSEEQIRKRLETLLSQVKEKTAAVEQQDRLAEEARKDAEKNKKEAEDKASRLEADAQSARDQAKAAEVESQQAGKNAAEKQMAADKSALEIKRFGARDFIEELGKTPETERLRNLIQQDLETVGVTEERLKTVEGLRETLKEASEVTNVLSEGFKIVTRDKQGWRLLFWVAIPPLAVMVAAWLTSWLTKQQHEPWVQSITSTVSAVATLIGGVVGFWKRYSPKLKPVLEAVTRLKQQRVELERKVEEKRQERARTAAELDKDALRKREEAAEHLRVAAQKAAEAEIARREAKEKVEAAEKARKDAAAAAAEVKKLQEEADALLPERRIAAFIQDRAGAKDYRQHLGVPALIRRDFEKLSAMFRTQREKEEKDEDGENAVGRNDLAIVNRIILYIDDLDRCPQDKVVEVLRAIHLLLAFPLFVVVVAVDARWMKRSLLDQFSLMLTSPSPGNANGKNVQVQEETLALGHMATPDDYLEKIFQIPFWIRPLSNDACKNLVDALTQDTMTGQNELKLTEPKLTHSEISPGGPASPGQPNPGNIPDAGYPIVTPPTSSGTEVPPPNNPVVTADPAGTLAQDQADNRFRWRDIEPKPRSLQLSPDERAYMLELAPIIGRSPRSVKRFVNCYRLLKSALDKDELSKATRDGTFRTTMLLLGLMTGLPEVGPELLADLRRTDRKKNPQGWIHDLAGQLDSEKKEKIAEIFPVMQRLGQVSKISTVGPLIEAAELVDRFSFSPVRTNYKPPA